MPESLHREAFLTAAGCTVALYVKQLIVNFGLGGQRFKSGGRPPEDSKLGLPGATSFADQNSTPNYGTSPASTESGIIDAADKAKAKEEEKRWQRMVQNDLENLPLGFTLMWASLLCLTFGTYDETNFEVFMAGCGLHAVGRYGHSYCFAKALQPWRTIFFALSQIGMLILAVILVVAADSVKNMPV
eukprot:m.45674 g.45674  ORF g.45674 m.45674 type:complete len:187 (-) comp10280_c0_seq2:49-609(-)